MSLEEFCVAVVPSSPDYLEKGITVEEYKASKTCSKVNFVVLLSFQESKEEGGFVI